MTDVLFALIFFTGFIGGYMVANARRDYYEKRRKGELK